MGEPHYRGVDGSPRSAVSQGLGAWTPVHASVVGMATCQDDGLDLMDGLGYVLVGAHARVDRYNGGFAAEAKGSEP